MQGIVFICSWAVNDCALFVGDDFFCETCFESGCIDIKAFCDNTRFLGLLREDFKASACADSVEESETAVEIFGLNSCLGIACNHKLDMDKFKNQDFFGQDAYQSNVKQLQTFRMSLKLINAKEL